LSILNHRQISVFGQWERLTFSRLTIAYIIFSLVHFGLQISLQTQAFIINAEAATFLFSIALQGNATNSSFPTLAGREIRMCAFIPSNLTTNACTLVYDGIPNNNSLYLDANAANAAIAAIPTAAFPTTVASSVVVPSASSVAPPSASAVSASSSAVSASASSTSSADVIVITRIVVETAAATASAAKPTPSSSVNLTTVNNEEDVEHPDRRGVRFLSMPFI
jgi:hypothetical protein